MGHIFCWSEKSVCASGANEVAIIRVLFSLSFIISSFSGGEMGTPPLCDFCAEKGYFEKLSYGSET